MAFLNSALIGRPKVFPPARRAAAWMTQRKSERNVRSARVVGDRLSRWSGGVRGSRGKREARESNLKHPVTNRESNSVMLSYDFRTFSLISWNNGRLETFPIHFRDGD